MWIGGNLGSKFRLAAVSNNFGGLLMNQQARPQCHLHSFVVLTTLSGKTEITPLIPCSQTCINY